MCDRFAARAVAACVLLILCGGGAVGDDATSAALSRIERPPLGLPSLTMPAKTPASAAAVTLGCDLFYDPRLSADGRFSCATCHKPLQAFTEAGVRTPMGSSGKPLARNAPTIVNSAYMKNLMHDGEGHSLETQILAPLFLPDEMGNSSIAAFVERIAALPDYAGRFEAAFAAPASIATIGKALATYERTLLSGNSPFDRWRYGGDETAMTPEAKVGYALFAGKAGCSSCHLIGEHDALFTDQGFHNTGIGARAEPVPGRAADLGREAVTHDLADRYKYRTPSLRNVAQTVPYMHDGSLATLADVVRFYNAGGSPNSGLDPAIRALGLSEAEIASLVAFLESLSGDTLEALQREASCR